MPAMASASQAQKRELRATCLARRAELTSCGLAAASAAIAARLFALAEFAAANVIHTYVSMEGEVETDGIVGQALATGRRVVVPVVVKGRRALRHAEIGSLDEL